MKFLGDITKQIYGENHKPDELEQELATIKKIFTNLVDQLIDEKVV